MLSPSWLNKIELIQILLHPSSHRSRNYPKSRHPIFFSSPPCLNFTAKTRKPPSEILQDRWEFSGVYTAAKFRLQKAKRVEEEREGEIPTPLGGSAQSLSFSREK